jgi:hypothetical protein
MLLRIVPRLREKVAFVGGRLDGHRRRVRRPLPPAADGYDLRWVYHAATLDHPRCAAYRTGNGTPRPRRHPVYVDPGYRGSPTW